MLTGRMMPAAIAAEWTKILTLRSVRSSLLLTIPVSAGLGYLVAHLLGSEFPQLPASERAHWDPLYAAFYSLTIGQLALVAFGVLAAGTEYSSGTIRTSLTAMPGRARFFAAKVAATALAAAGISLLTVAATFAAARAALGPHAAGLTARWSAQAIAGAWLYLILICVLASGLAMALRSSALSLSILMPLLFLGSQGLGNVPEIRDVTEYLPDQAGMVIMHLTGVAGDPRFTRPYGPWAGLGIMAAWAAAALACGYLVLRRSDA
jgi:ABC-type transport system involved in multi-copper enzyme maturation permease subunit